MTQKALPWASRIVGHADVPPADLIAHPLNFRRHPEEQTAALRGSVSTLGWIKEVLVNRTTGRILDGHARVELAIANGGEPVPVTYVELSEDEERLALAVLDPITEMATRDDDKARALLEGITTDDAGLQALLDSIADDAALPAQLAA